MKLSFRKMNGAGNDFVIANNMDGAIAISGEQVASICDRRRGVGADGLILIEPHDGYDFQMNFYNSDGTEAEMCGNGGRCAARFASDDGLGRPDGESVQIRFWTPSGDIDARVKVDRVSMSMMDAKKMRLDIAVQVAQPAQIAHFMVVGTRHAVVLVDDVADLTYNDIMELGSAVRYHAAFEPMGVNVNFASVDAEGRVHIRTYEKGVEAETHACGTGSIAAAVVLAHLGRGQSPTAVVQKQGDVLSTSFELQEGGAGRVVLEGPVAVNFVGTIEI